MYCGTFNWCVLECGTMTTVLLLQFLYEPFPVESSLKEHLHDHINAEIVTGTICHKEDAVHYLTWTYLFRRLVSFFMIMTMQYENEIWTQVVIGVKFLLYFPYIFSPIAL